MSKVLMIVSASLALVLLLSAAADARTEGFGLGIILGEPTGVTAKTWLDRDSAIDFAAAWSFRDTDSFHFHADYLIHKGGLLELDAAEHMLYFGAGGVIEFRDDRKGHDTEAGIRLPFGVAFHLKAAPVELFGEIVPVMEVAPSTGLHMNAGIGARYYF
jgi:hypothetical protein